MKSNASNWLHITFLIMILSVLGGCSSAPPSPAPSLLEQDYTTLKDADLIAYEQQLNDELAKISRSSSGDVSLGIGFGTWGNSGGFGVSADKWVAGGENSEAMELRNRRDAVRTEMRRRGLLK